MEKTIKLAIEGGYKNIKSRVQYRIEEVEDRAYIVFGQGNYSKMIYFTEMVLDPLFWQCLGKALGWGKSKHTEEMRSIGLDWKYHWHYFIDHLAEGKDIDEFFTNLLK